MNKIVNIIKQYKDLSYIIEQLRQKTKLDEIDGIFHKNCKLQTEIYKTVKKLVLKYCLQYYKYKKLFCDYLKMSLSTFIELQQFIYSDNQIVNNTKLRKYDKNFQKAELLLLDSKGLSNQNGKKDII